MKSDAISGGVIKAPRCFLWLCENVFLSKSIAANEVASGGWKKCMAEGTWLRVGKAEERRRVEKKEDQVRGGVGWCKGYENGVIEVDAGSIEALLLLLLLSASIVLDAGVFDCKGRGTEVE